MAALPAPAPAPMPCFASAGARPAAASGLRDALHAALAAMWRAPDAAASKMWALKTFAEDAVIDVCAPVERVVGAEAFYDAFVAPVRAALQPRIQRRDDIFIGGVTRSNDREREDEGTRDGIWVAATGHYMGNFVAPLFGVPPAADGRLVVLRFGEYYRVDAASGAVLEAKIMVDLLDLALRAGHEIPLPHLLGTEGIYPPPATHDGVKPNDKDGSLGVQAAELVEAMLFDLHAFDPATFQSKNMTGKQGYWHADMMWYGPAGIGANFTYAGFDKHHRVSFLTAFPDREGGNHYCRIGDGNYVASSGWPSMTMTHAGDYLGVKATNRAMTLRVMDLWRCEDGQIMENWVLLDLVHLFDQMGVDLIGGIHAAN